MVVLTLGIIELVLSQLAGIEEGDGRLVEEITQGNNTRKDVERALTQLYQVQQDQNVGHQARTELLSAVHFISQWKPGKELFSCAANNFSMTHPNWQPAARAATASLARAPWSIPETRPRSCASAESNRQDEDGAH